LACSREATSIVPSNGSPRSQLYAGDYAQQEINGDHAYVQGIDWKAFEQTLIRAIDPALVK
jgi:hypothetical protein